MPDPVLNAEDEERIAKARLEVLGQVGGAPQISDVLRRLYIAGIAQGMERVRALTDEDCGPCLIVNGNLVVNCNDTFGYACADFEEVPDEDVSAVYAAHKADRKYGVLKWAIARRGQPPIREVAEAISRASQGVEEEPR